MKQGLMYFIKGILTAHGPQVRYLSGFVNNGVLSYHAIQSRGSGGVFKFFKNNSQVVDPKANQDYIKQMTANDAYGNDKAQSNLIKNFIGKLKAPITKTVEKVLKPKQ